MSTFNPERVQLVRDHYINKRWDINRVHRAVGIWISEEDYKDITGFDYPNKA